mgnify:CR=1 FL=1
MTEKDFEDALSQIAINMKNKQIEIISHLNPNNFNELKARKIAINIFDNGYKFVKMKFSSESFDKKYYEIREKKVFHCPDNIMYFKSIKEKYNQLSENNKKFFLIYAHSVQSLKMCIGEPKNNELDKAKLYDNVEKIFECELILTYINDLIVAWTDFWNDFGVLKVEDILL